ncbi:FAD dependent oxidoreductase [Hyphomicrobium denitrificans 1NES1]|uniref:FAD dependent oxidoreductase n=1 Tax=Hyphomicrobium denitrificans 1NES1 TaxID=670307 RepID=N0BBT2_9HYPH|nr:NAD(P)/FAD-dependent oxidoreductase [Hyphomicrobium denitrificans]AGK57580.1 FAD dependent oxidoreductase [Hyphomicrobium denitrificans 1NES1]
MPPSSTPDIETIIIGGGVVGLAIAAECAKAGQETYVLERHSAIGEEVSSRSSEVIHAGLYYPNGSLKARLCVEGRDLLYAYARDRDVDVRRLGKLVVATSPAEETALEAIAVRAKANGVGDIQILSAADIHALEPEIVGTKALFSPSTGIVDSHGLMQALATDLANHGGAIVLQTAVQSITLRTDGLFEIGMTSSSEPAKIMARNLIAAAGLGMAELGAHLPHAESYASPTLHFAKGHYFALRHKSAFRHLIYPVPVDGGLGTHLTLDLEGNVRFGPDVQWIERIDYAFDDPGGTRMAEFERSIRRYWPDLPANALSPSYTGIRPKISRQGQPAQDFAIHGPRQHGIPRLVALYGIESPGLTSSLTIAKYCHALLDAH